MPTRYYESRIVKQQLLGGSLAAANTTPGAAMMNLRFRNERAAGNGGRTGVEGPSISVLQRIALVLGWVVLPYAWQRGVGAVALAGWHHHDPHSLQGRIATALPCLEAVTRAASLINALAFLRWGRYRSLLERILATRLVYDRAVMARVVSFDYLNRQLVWSEVSELFLCLLPLLDTRRAGGLLSNWARRVLAPLRVAVQHRGDGVAADACQVCTSQPANTPYAAAPCGHVFCYFCLRARTESDVGYCCPTCEQPIRGMVPAAVCIEAVVQQPARKPS